MVDHFFCFTSDLALQVSYCPCGRRRLPWEARRLAARFLMSRAFYLMYKSSFNCCMWRPSHSHSCLIIRKSESFASYARRWMILKISMRPANLPFVIFKWKRAPSYRFFIATYSCASHLGHQFSPFLSSQRNALTNFPFWLTWQFRRREWRTAGRRSQRWRRRQRAKSKPFGRQRRSRLAIGSGSCLAEHAPKTRIVSLPRGGNVAEIHVEKLVFGLGRVSHITTTILLYYYVSITLSSPSSMLHPSLSLLRRLVLLLLRLYVVLI